MEQTKHQEELINWIARKRIILCKASEGEYSSWIFKTSWIWIRADPQYADTFREADF